MVKQHKGRAPARLRGQALLWGASLVWGAATAITATACGRIGYDAVVESGAGITDGSTPSDATPASDGAALPQADGAQPEVPLTADGQTLALFHLDDDVVDAGPLAIGPQIWRGQARYGAGRFGRAIDLDGTRHFHTPGVSDAGIADESFTLELSVQAGAQSATPSALLAHYMAVSSTNQATLQLFEGKLRWVVDARGVQAVSTSTEVASTLMDGAWHAVRCVRDQTRGGDLRLYVDGAEVSYVFRQSQPRAFNPSEPRWALGVGGLAHSDRSFDFVGRIDEVRLSRTLR